MDEQTFFERFFSLLVNTKDKYELGDIHDSLIVWFGENYLSIDPIEVKDRIVTDSHAEGIDAVLIDRINYRLIFIQARTVKDYKNAMKNYSETDIKSTIAGVNFLVRGDYKGKITTELENLIDEYHELDKTGTYKTLVLFVALKKPPLDDKFIKHFEKEFGQIKVVFFDFNQLYNFYKNDYLIKTAKPPEKISFKVLATVLKKNTPHKSTVFTTKGEEIAKVYNDYRERIFQQNVRYSLGMRVKSINRQIFDTAVQDTRSENFWYFNNGITIVCDEIHEPQSGKVINLKNAQIINGAQTTYALHEAYQNGTLKDNVEVLIKAIETTNKIFIESVTLYTNSQNAIKIRDLLSNLEIQISIQKILLDSYKYFYERKRGEFDSLYPTLEAKTKLLGIGYKNMLISNENAAQAFLALYLNKPAQAKSEKGRIFMRDEGFYDEIFNAKDEIIAEKLLFAWKLLKYIERHKGKYHLNYKSVTSRLADKTLETMTEDEKKEIVGIYYYDYLLHAEYFILNLFKDFLQNKGFDISINKTALLSAMVLIDSDDKIIKDIYKTIINNLAEYIRELIRKNPGYYHNKFFKNEKSIGLIRNYFNGEHTFVEVIEKQV